MLKIMATGLQRHFGPPPTEYLKATGRKAFPDANTEGNARAISKVARGGAGGEDLDSRAESNWDLCFDQDDIRR